MQVQVKVSAKAIFTVEGDKAADLFERVAELQEVFGYDRCGKCGSDAIRFRVRSYDGNKYYELVCLACRAALSFGCKKQPVGALFPKTSEKTSDGGYVPLPHGGWKVWQSKSEEGFQ